MKKLIFIMIWITTTGSIVHGQRAVSISPIIGINSTLMNLHEPFGFDKYDKSGSYLLIGVESELRLTRKDKRVDLSIVSGVNYLANGFRYSGNFTFSDFLYSYRKMELEMQYIQIPLEIKLNWQPLPLIPEFKLFLGGGVNFNLLQKATLSEQGIDWVQSSDIMNPPPVTNYYADEGDMTLYRNKLSVFRRAEIGLKYKRVKIAYRVSRSLQDMYFKGLENDWAVPVDNSIYLSGQKINGTIHEKHIEIVLGFRIF